MNFFDGIKVFKKDSFIRKELDSVIEKLPNSEEIAKDLLKKLGNKKTKCLFDEDIKGNYYVYLNDTIYLCNKQNKKDNYERLCVIAHECIHSIQPKWLQKLNFIFSNLETIFFVLAIILYFLKITNVYLFSMYIAIAIFSIIPRLVLEIWAMLNAPKLSKKYLEEKNFEKDDIKKVENVYNFSTKILMPFAIIQMFFFKLLRITLISILNFYKF